MNTRRQSDYLFSAIRVPEVSEADARRKTASSDSLPFMVDILPAADAPEADEQRIIKIAREAYSRRMSSPGGKGEP